MLLLMLNYIISECSVLHINQFHQCVDDAGHHILHSWQPLHGLSHVWEENKGIHYHIIEKCRRVFHVFEPRPLIKSALAFATNGAKISSLQLVLPPLLLVVEVQYQAEPSMLVVVYKHASNVRHI